MKSGPTKEKDAPAETRWHPIAATALQPTPVVVVVDALKATLPTWEPLPSPKVRGVRGVYE